MGAAGRRPTLLFATLLAVVLLPGLGFAEDVPDDARKAFERAQRLFAEGDAKSVQKAKKALDKIRTAGCESITYWKLYHRIWKRLGRDDASFWKKVGEPCQQKQPDSPVFDLLRAELEPDLQARRPLIEAAVKRSPDDVRPKLALVKLLLRLDEEWDAEEILEGLVEEHPDDEQVILIKGSMDLRGGYPRTALTDADEKLKTHPKWASLHDLRARAMLAMFDEEELKSLDEAVKASERAVELRPDPDFVYTLACLYQRQSNRPRALSLLKEHYERSRSPILAAYLGRIAFIEGDYKTAVSVLDLSARSDAHSARALAWAHARLGNTKAANAALEQMVSLDPSLGVYAATVETAMHRPHKALAYLKDCKDEHAPRMRLFAEAMTGKLDGIEKEHGDAIRSASVMGEWWAVTWLRGRLINAMGLNAANAFANRLAKARAKAAAIGASRPKASDEGPSMPAKTAGLMHRAVGYHRSVCGSRFTSVGSLDPHFSMDTMSGITFYYAVWGSSDCEGDPYRLFPYNKKQGKKGEEEELAIELGDFAPAEAAFGKGFGALFEGKTAQAIKEFEAALDVEPHWHRAAICRAVALAIHDKNRRGEAASKAWTAAQAYPTDFWMIETALMLRAWAGESIERDAADYADRYVRYEEKRIGSHL